MSNFGDKVQPAVKKETKNVANDRTYTEIHPLDEEGRVEALARLISGDHVTELSRANAREMLGLGAK